jgi:transposase-like protein
MAFEQESRYGSRWETIRSIAQKLGCSTEALRNWVKRVEIDAGRASGVTSEERSRIKDLGREISEPR